MKPKTAYDYRRCITLVQTLAMDTEHLERLATAWGIDDSDLSVLSSRYEYYRLLVQRLAQHALEHARSEQTERN
jgi:hypothetical protein